MPRRDGSLTTSRAARAALVLAVAVGAASALFAGQRITTLDGREVELPAAEADFQQQQEALLAAALAARDAAPGDPESWLWVGRRQAYLGRLDAAVATFGEGLERFPEDARFLRHRGHRFVSLRRLDEAVADLSRAAKMTAESDDAIEPDGLPNALGIPTSTLKTNIWYHLGLALYLRKDFTSAAAAYRKCVELSGNPDMLVAASYWLYLSQRRDGQDEEARTTLAAIGPGLELIENDGYYELLRMFAGDGDAEALLAGVRADAGAVAFPTTAYGIGAWHLIHGRSDLAAGLFREILASPAITAFGYIAAEAELVGVDRQDH